MSEIKVVMSGAKSADLYIYDEIGGGFFGGVGAKEIIAEVNKLKKIDTLNVRINSIGGDVFEGLAIYNFLKRYPADVIVSVDGLAASIASIIALAGSEVNIAQNAMFMIHEPFSAVMGTAEDMRRKAELLDTVTSNAIDIYVAKTNQPREKVSAMVAEETWFTAAEAVQFGFADRVTEELKVAAKFDPSKFRNAPKGFGMSAEAVTSNIYRARLADMARCAKGHGVIP
jgi:ATP-dependent Clp protease protease subunit